MQETYFYLAPGSEHSYGMEVTEGGTLEVTVTQFWSSLGSSVLKVAIYRRGITVHLILCA